MGGTEVTISGSNFDSLISQDTQQNWIVSTLDSDAIPSGGVSIAIDKPENKIYAIYKVNENGAGNYLMKMDRNIGALGLAYGKLMEDHGPV